MRRIKIAIVVTVISLFGFNSYGVEFFDIDGPGIKKKAIFLVSLEKSTGNRAFTSALKSVLDQSLLIQVSDDKPISDLLVTLGGTVEKKQMVVQISGLKDVKFETMSFGLKFQNSDNTYVQLKAAQTGNRILKQLFDIDGSFGSKITWSNVENGRKVIYRAAFGLPDTTEQVTYNLYTNYGAQWGEDMKNIIYTAHTDKGTTVMYQQFSPLRYKAMDIAPQIGLASSPSWGPDGTVFLSAHVSEQNSDIIQYKLPGDPYKTEGKLSQVRKWTFGKSIETEPQVSPDGKSMVYVSDQTAAPQVYLLTFSSGKAKRLTRTGGYNVTPVWSPNGKVVAYRGIRNGVSSIFRIDVASGQEKRLTPPTIDAESPTWSPDGSLIAFSGKAAGEKSEIRKVYYTLSSGSGNEIRELATPINHKNQSNPSWGPAL